MEARFRPPAGRPILWPGVRASRAALAMAGVAACVAVLFAPVAGWLVRQQLRAVFLPPDALIWLLMDAGVKETPFPIATGSWRRADARLAQAARRHPDDVGMQVALHDAGGSPQDSLRRLRDLARRFPGRPDVVAHLLRHEVACGVHDRRRAVEEFFDRPAAGVQTLTPNETLAGPLASAWEADAARGERLEPDNAFFPLMRAAGLYATRRDAEGLAALHRAAACPRYEDYLTDGVEGASRLFSEAYDDRSALTRTMLRLNVRMPHLAAMRDAADTAIWQAAASERAGRMADGLAARHSVMQVGALVRSHSRWAIGSECGALLVSIAAWQPGGALPAPGESLWREEPAGRTAEAYAGWLERNGRPAEAGWVRRQIADNRAAADVLRWRRNPDNLGSLPLLRCTAWWLLDLALLSAALWAGATTALALLAGRGGGNGWWPKTAVLACAAGMAVSMSVQFLRNASALLCLQEVTNYLGSFALGEPPPPSMALYSWMACLAYVIPAVALLCLAGGSVLARVRSVLLLAGVRRFVGAAACLLVLLYAGALAGTMRADAAQNAALARSEQHEGRYLADQAGRHWPPREP